MEEEETRRDKRRRGEERGGVERSGEERGRDQLLKMIVCFSQTATTFYCNKLYLLKVAVKTLCISNRKEEKVAFYLVLVLNSARGFFCYKPR